MAMILASDLQAGLIPEIVDGMLPETGVGLAWGESAAGKSFVSWKMALNISDGSPFLGHETLQGKVVYVVSEGERGAANRKTGAIVHSRRLVPAAECRSNACYGANCKCTDEVLLDDSNVIFICDTPFKLYDKPQVTGLIRALQKIPDLRLVVFDTLSGLAGCSLDWPKYANDVMEQAKKIAREAGCFVLLIHHATKKGDQFRGAQPLFDASDVFMRVIGPENGEPGEIICQKMKDSKPFETIHFELEPVRFMAKPDDPKPVETLVAVEVTDVFRDMPELGRLPAARRQIPQALPQAVPVRRRPMRMAQIIRQQQAGR